MTVNATDDTFQKDVLESGKTVVVDFWATWCGPCRMVSPVLEKIAQDHPEIELVKVDIDANPVVASEYQVRSIPFMIVFQNGKRVKEVIGAKPRAALLKEFADYLQ